MPLPRTVDDFRLYYDECYVQLKLNGRWRWRWCATFEGVDRGIIMHSYDAVDRHVQFDNIITKEDGLNFKVEYPDCKYYYHKESGQARLLIRKVVRNSSRGLCITNGKFVNPLNLIVPDNFQRPDRWEHVEIIQALENNKSDFHIEEAVQMIGGGEALSVPTKNHWMISPAPVEKFDFLLWFRTVPVALFNANGKTDVFNHVYKQEIHDEFGGFLQQRMVA